MSIIAANSHVLYGQFKLKDHHQQQQQLISSVNSFFSPRTSGFWVDFGVREEFKRSAKRDFKTQAFWPNLSKPETIEMEPINDDDHLDQILSHAKERSQPILIDWMASWCRKCIYLKPKLEKLAAEYDSKVKFYCVDVNKVPQTLVKRGNISKMPTMQIWVDGEMKEEVIGGHKAWIVINEVEEMLKKYV